MKVHPAPLRARTVAWCADEAAELGCAVVPHPATAGVWLVYADREQADVLDELRRETGLPGLSWEASTSDIR